jgi:hypothetical protein
MKTSDDAFNMETKLEHVSAVRSLSDGRLGLQSLALLKTLCNCIVLKGRCVEIETSTTRRNQRRISHSPSWLRKNRHPNKNAVWCRVATILTQVNVFEQNHYVSKLLVRVK